MNLRASRNRILPVVIVLFALAAGGHSQRRSSASTPAAPKPGLHPVFVAPQPAGTPADVASSGSPVPSTAAKLRAATPPEPTPHAQEPAAAGMVIGVDPET